MAEYGYGSGPWGGVPWGGSLTVEGELIPGTQCGLFLFEHCASMLDILISPIISTVGDVEQFVLNYPDPPATSCDLGMLSGELGNPAFSTNNAYITAVPPAGVDDVCTLEITVLQEELPNDFADISNRHFGFQVTDSTGACAAFFVSKVGFAYAGAFHHVGGTLVLDSSLQIIPATAPFVLLGEYVTYRVAVSGLTGAVYFYATRTADLGGGHQLVAILPTIDASELVTPPVQDQAVISVRGTTSQPTRVSLDRWCLSADLIVANLLPIANAGQDQAVRLCSLALLDGTASFDPEGASLLYHWRLINAPSTSSFVFEGADGSTMPALVPTGFTDRFFSPSLATLHGSEPIQAGDVLLYDAQPWTIVETGFDPGFGFFVRVDPPTLPDILTNAQFRLVRQYGITDSDTAKPSFFPDVVGFYSFDLVVFDGALFSEPSVVILNVLDSVLPFSCAPDAGFIANYLSDFWALVEGVEIFDTFWSSLAQVAATELYSLWQHEYSKSLRDVQRTIVRRWLHYDLMLEEPVPEETTIRAIWAGVTSDGIDAAVGNPAMAGTTLVISSPISGTLSIALPGVVFAEDLIAVLEQGFKAQDDRYSVQLVPELGTPTFYVVRIDAPFPFEISSDSTCPVFTVGDGNGSLEGSGAAIGTDTYVVNRSLLGVDIQENDVLVIDGVGYRIVRVIDGEAPADTYPSQRVVVKDSFPVAVGTSWAIGSLSQSRRLDFYKGLVSIGDHAYYEIDIDDDDQPDELIEVPILGTAENLPNSLVIDATALGVHLATAGTSVRLAKIIRRTYLPISKLIVGVPTLQEHIIVEDTEGILRRNLDYYIEDYHGQHCLRFLSGVFEEEDVWEGAVPPTRLWAEYTYVDNNPTIEANFGIPADFSLDELELLPTDVDYLSAVRGLWYSYIRGPTVFSARVGAQIFLGLPFAEQGGTIVEIREDFSPNEGRLLIQDLRNAQIIRSYRYPLGLPLEVNPGTGERYAVGDIVEQFAPLVEGVEVIDYIDDPVWYKGLLSQGLLAEVQKYHTFLVRVDSTIFNLDALLLTQRMILKIKPTWKNIFYTVELDLGIDDVDVTDQVEFEGTLTLYDSPCPWQGIPLLDMGCPAPVYVPEYPPTPNNTAYGQYCNQVDDDEWHETGEPPGPLTCDGDYCRPENELEANVIQYFGSPWIPLLDTVLRLDTGIMTIVQFGGIPSLPITQAGVVIPIWGSGVVADDGNLTEVKTVILGTGPGSDPTDYEFAVAVSGLGEVVVVPFDASDEFIEVNYILPVPVAVTASAAVTLTVRIPAGSPDPDPRYPDWTLGILGVVTVESPCWLLDTPLPAGAYIDRHRPL